MVELIRSLLIEGLVERGLKFRLPRRLRGVDGVRREAHLKNRERLLNRLSTEGKEK
jgi:hypothetical protein